MIKISILFIAFFWMLTLTVQASEKNIKRAFTVTSLALDAQAAREARYEDINEEKYEDINETNLEGGTKQ